MKIDYRIMQNADIEQVSDILAKTFVKHEPVTNFLKIDKNSLKTYTISICEDIVRDELSIVAKIGSEIIGARLAGDFLSQSAHVTAGKLEIINNLLDALHANTDMDFLMQKKCLHMKMMGVDERYHNHGIAQQLLSHTFNNARQRGYNYTLVEANTPITQYIFMQKLQFKLLNKILLKTFRHRGNAVLENMPEQFQYWTLLGNHL